MLYLAVKKYIKEYFTNTELTERGELFISLKRC